jgi:lysophospholipase L1-like esterase/pimeloyl-ACP methyl ester carboxylesterase
MLVKVNQLFKAVFVLLFLILSSNKGQAQESDYHGFKCLDFKFEGHDAKIVFPEIAEKERHWIWRARFWGHEPQTEIALLEKGFHVVFIDAAEYCGNSEAVKLWDHFYEFLKQKYHLNSKVVLEGFSRGGLYIYNWGSENVEKVACIYADAPVCDINSWPGGKGKGKGSPSDWQLHLKVYNLTEETVSDFRGMPVYNARMLAEAGVPVLHVCGAADEVVPIDENTYLLEKTYKDAGGDIKIIVKEGIGHHPHSLKDPAPIVNFILTHTSPGLLDEPMPLESKMDINFRGNVDNCRLKFEQDKKGRVAFLGGSITWNPGWRDMVCEYLKNRFPSTEFEFISAGIPSLGSTPGAMRLYRDVLSKGSIDLLIVEAAVNDATNDTNPVQPLRGMEGIINHALKTNPNTDIVMLHFVDQGKMADYNNDITPEVIRQHEKVAEHYGIPSINLAKEVNDRIINGEFTWRDDFKNLHPSPFGQQIYFRTIEQFLETSWQGTVASEYKSKKVPSQPIDQYSYIDGNFMPLKNAKLGKGWSLVEDWKPDDKASTRSGFVNDMVLEAFHPGATLKLKFAGKAIGLFVTSGPDAGIVEYSIDGSEFKSADQFTQWSSHLHLPWLIILDDELPDRKHTLILRVASDKNQGSIGYACRIHQFAVNE